jgi:hypothetical protein
MQIASNFRPTTVDDFKSQPDNQVENKQLSTNTNSSAETSQSQNQSTQPSNKYQQYNSFESNYFKSLINTALPNNKSSAPNQINTNLISGDKVTSQPNNQFQDMSTSMNTKSEAGKVSNTSSKSGYDVNKIPGLKNNPNVTPEFLAKVDVIAKELESEPSTILSIISYETITTFSPSKESPKTKATGLIQFLPSTAKSLLTKELIDPKIDLNDKKKVIDNLPVNEETKKELTKAVTDISDLPIRKEQLKSKVDSLTDKSRELNNKLSKAKNLPKEQQEQIKSQLKEVLTEKSKLIAEKNLLSKEVTRLPQSIDNMITKDIAIKAFKQMSSVKQLDYVKQYLLPYKGKLNSPQDAYLAVLYPKAVGQGSNPNYVVFSEGSSAYTENRHFDGAVNGKKDGNITVQEATKQVVDSLKVARLK